VDVALFVRHAESEYSAKGLVNGDPAVPVGLTATGERQARALRALLAAEPIDLCVVTEFPRTQATADLALDGRSVPRLVVRDLNDPDYGEFEGAALDDYRAWVAAQGSRVRIRGSGESRLDLVRRYVRGFRTVLGRPETTVLCVLHSLPLAYLLAALEERDPAPRMALVGYTEVVWTTAVELAPAVERLETWCLAPTW
jgi:2,3-bisphosphoglycerate-dependent phosphoglycerate mutase